MFKLTGNFAYALASELSDSSVPFINLRSSLPSVSIHWLLLITWKALMKTGKIVTDGCRIFVHHEVPLVSSIY
jgi:hypothetical protein